MAGVLSGTSRAKLLGETVCRWFNDKIQDAEN
jgi:hypothetical protein